MRYSPNEIDNRLRFFTELLSYNSGCYLWTYTADGTLMNSNCNDLVFEKMFRRSGCFDYMMNHARENRAPLLLGSHLGLVWGAVFELEEDRLSRIHVLGPAFTQTVSQRELEKMVWDKITPSWKNKFMKFMERVPILSITMFSHRIMMMEYCLTGERIEISDIHMQSEDSARKDRPGRQETGLFIDRIQVYMAEQALYSMIRNGDMNYQNALLDASRVISGNRILSSDPVQHAKLGQVQFVALCCNAAVEGGLSAETAYTRKDAYIQDLENAKTISEITQISKTMYVDYITLVHRQRINPAYSKVIQSSIDYIENHIHEKLTVESVASRVGYSAYYLSRVFKKETGFTIDEYARNAKIERAKLLLSSSNASIQEISEKLGFNGRNYFSVIFRKVTGIPPAEYRKKHQKL